MLSCALYFISSTPLYAALLYDAILHSPGITVSPQHTGLQLSEGEAELGLKSDRVLDQLVFVIQVDPTALQVLLHHLLELPDSLLQLEIQAQK